MNSVKRRGGKPNRGGGRGTVGGGANRGRGNGSAGRGNRGGGNRGGGRGSATGIGSKGFGGSRKQNYDLLPDDDIPLMKSNKSYDEPPQRIIRKPPSKVAMQTLHMSQENQDMVYQMLVDVHRHDSDADRGFGATVNVLDHRDVSHYWTKDNKLQIEGSQSHGIVVGATLGDLANEDLLGIPLKKLQRYGFDKQRCLDALNENDKDVGAALESLISISCDVSLTPVDCEATYEEVTEQRQEEMLALSSIYGESFEERLPNRVWSIKIDLPSLNDLLQRKQQPSARTITAQTESTVNESCRFFLKGSCRYGRRCRYKHVLEVETAYSGKTDTTIDCPDENNCAYIYELEIRFPKDNKYPYQCPIVAFSSTNDALPRYCCLNMTMRLIEEAKSCLSDNAMPIVFTLVSILDDENEWVNILSKPEHLYSLTEPIISRINHAKKLQYNDHEMEDSDRVDASNNGNVSEEEENVTKQSMKSVEKPIRRANRGNETNMKLDSFKDDLRIRDKFKAMVKRDSYQKILTQRKKLPAWDMQNTVIDVIANNQVTVISGMTGCGKTTQVPQFILDSFIGKKQGKICNIIVTQPRRISAMAVAERVSEERCDKIGGIVGYQIRLENRQSRLTRLLFCTTGILLRRLEVDMDLEGVTHIIIDEVHERSEDSDFLMMVMRDLLNIRPDIKLILMSATLNADLFSQYFGDCPAVDIPGKTFPVDKIFLEEAIEMTGYVLDEGSPFCRPAKIANAIREEIEDMMDGMTITSAGKPAKDNIRDENLSVKQMFIRYSDCMKKTIKYLSLMDHEKINYELIEAILVWISTEGKSQYSDGAVLIFLPGYAEITTLYEQLMASSSFGGQQKHKYRIIPLHSTLSMEEQHAVFSRPREGVTKIVIATNIAETSITIDDVVFVIDCGKMKEKRFDHSKSMESLDTVWVSRANAVQRSGRAGRVAAGVSFHLFTKHRFQHNIRDQPIPEIQRASLEQLILKIKILEHFKGKNVKKVLKDLLEPPDSESVLSSIKRLQDLGALHLNEELTPLGYHLAFLPVDVRIGKLMLFGAIFRCLDPALTIAACLSFKSPFVAPFDKRDDADKKKLEFATGNSDHLTVLKAYKGWTSACKTGHQYAYRYCQDNYLSIKTMQMLASLKRQFVELLSDIGFVIENITARDIERRVRDRSDGVSEATGEQYNINSENIRLVSAMLCAALYPNVVQIMTPEVRYKDSSAGAVVKPPKPDELKLKTKADGYVNIHPSSINFQVNYYESPYLVYHEKVKTSKVYLRDCSMASPYSLILFGGSVSIDLYNSRFILSLDDGWIRFLASSHKVAELVREMRQELDELLAEKINQPDMDLCNCPRGSRIIDTIVHLITTQH
ncbi:putative ATP-dependent RNA helicase DHX57 [Tubulanus polymorphus]|uniref:putative ATP-dependent RNA helicase DHX57 n=1 Tax=Tubulanus polymorphus TaxID=672921 RepID=UPI003DA46F1A